MNPLKLASKHDYIIELFAKYRNLTFDSNRYSPGISSNIELYIKIKTKQKLCIQCKSYHETFQRQINIQMDVYTSICTH